MSVRPAVSHMFGGVFVLVTSSFLSCAVTPFSSENIEYDKPPITLAAQIAPPKSKIDQAGDNNETETKKSSSDTAALRVAEPVKKIKNDVLSLQKASVSSKSIDSHRPILNASIQLQARPRIQGRSQGLFNTLELEFSDTEKITAWASVARQLKQDTRGLQACLNDERYCSSDSASDWARDIRSFKNLSQAETLYRVNSHVNRLPYREDKTTYARPDHWSPPREFLTRGGDCEDYALLKMASLSALGFAQEDMRVVVGKLDDGRAHAVLNVNLKGADFILDNRKNETHLSANLNFNPKYSVNFDKRWTHIERKTRTLYAENNAR